MKSAGALNVMYAANRYADDWDQFKAVEIFVRHMPRMESDPGDIRFLTASDLPNREKKVADAYLGPYAAFVDDDDGHLVNLDRPDKKLVAAAKYYHTRFLVALSRRPQDIAKFRQWLAEQGMTTTVFRAFPLPFRDSVVEVVVLERDEFLPALPPG